MKRTAKRTVSEQLRAAMERSGMSRYAIASATGISQAVLSRFARGVTGLNSPNLDALCLLLRLELKPRGRATKGR
jgi:transcriptional regulator with XRE-family HTH domain